MFCVIVVLVDNGRYSVSSVFRCRRRVEVCDCLVYCILYSDSPTTLMTPRRKP
jgi:hypothetical protein